MIKHKKLGVKIMTIVDVKEAFQQCEFPFYKNLEMTEDQATCTVYSIYSEYKQEVILPLMNFDALLHQISIEIIKLRSAELFSQQQQIIECGI